MLTLRTMDLAPDDLAQRLGRLGAAERNPTLAEDLGLAEFCYRATQPADIEAFRRYVRQPGPWFYFI